MATKKSGLGKGYSQLLYDNTPETEEKSPLSTLKLSEIAPRSGQPRKTFDPEAINELAESISKHGLIQPIIVREGKGGFYEIIAGERRWRASRQAGLTEVPVIIIEADDKKTAELSLIENIQRRDLDALEQAYAYKELMERYEMTQEELSSTLSISRPAIANTVRLLELPDLVQALVKEGKLSAGHARTLLSLRDGEKMEMCAQIVVEKQLSVRQTEALVKQLLTKKEEKEEKLPAHTVDYKAELEKKARSFMGRNVQIVDKGRSKKLVLEYTDNEDLEFLLTALCGSGIFDD